MWSDLKKFIARGNVVDLGVAVIIGAAFTQIVNTIAQGIIALISSLITNGIRFIKGQEVTEMTAKEISEKGLAVFRFEDLIANTINLLIVAFVVSFIARWAARYFGSLESEPPPMTKSDELLEEIHDLLRGKIATPSG